MSEWALATFIVFLASALQAATGFGFSIMATPFLLLVFNSHDAIQISIIISLFISIVMMPRIWRDVDRELLRRLIVGSAIGGPLGVALFAHFSIFLLKVTVSVVILIVTACLIIRSHKDKKSMIAVIERNGSSLEEQSPIINTTSYSKRNELMVGFCAGVLTTSIGMPGPPLLLYFNAKSIKKEILRSTTLAFFIFIYTISLIIQAMTVEAKYSVVTSSLILIPVAILGVLIGSTLFKRINQKMFQFTTYIILIYTGIYMLVKTIIF